MDTEQRIKNLEARVEALDGYATKLPAYARLVARWFRLESLINRFENSIGKTNIEVTHKAADGEDRVIFLCTHNQAAKLREFADEHGNIKHKQGERNERLQTNKS